MKIFFFIFFLLFAPHFFLKPSQAKKLLTEKKAKIKSSVLKNEKPIQTDKARKKQSLEACNYSAKSQRHLKSHTINNIIHFSTSQIEDLVDDHFSYIRKGWPKQCPSYCEQINNYEMLSKIYPKSTTKGSCKKEESKESYSFKKQFPFQQNKGSITKAHEEMRNWILSVFVYPYYPFAATSKEFTERKLSEACPSCSFYIDYTYRYTRDNNLDLDIIARCGDKRKFLSSYEMEFILINNWSCKKKTKQNDSG